MKKLRITQEDKVKILEDIQERLTWFNNSIESFDIKDLLKEHAKISEDITKPTLLITVEAYTKMYELVRQSPVEIQWHMLVKRNVETNTYMITDILLFPQTNSGTSTTTDQDEFAKWQMELIMDPEFPLEELRGHGHSHVNMGVFSSGVDDAYQKDLITKVEDGDYYVFLVLNKKMDMYALIYDFERQVLFNTSDIDIEIIYAGTDIRAWCKEQIKQYCKEAKTKVATTYKPPNKKDQRDEYISTMLPSEAQVRAFWERR